MMKAEHKHLAEQGVKLVELRLDYIRKSVNLARLLEDRPSPVIATCRRPHDGGKWERTEQERLILLRTAIADGVDYVDLEQDIAEEIPRYGTTKRIISYHNFRETPANIEAIHHSITKLDPDIIKIITMANHPNDNIRVLKLCKASSVPTAAFCMGEIGLPSRVLCGKFGSPLTYATFHQSRQFAPGQLSVGQMRDDYRYDEIGPDTRVLGLVADPVAHSFSPRIQNALIRNSKLDMIYLPFRVPSETLTAFMDRCTELGVVGLSISIPHKEKVLRSLTGLDDDVVGIRAANTVVFKNRDVVGYNTDCAAAMASLQQIVPMADDKLYFKGYSALVLGAGGTAKAVGYGLKRLGASVYICARDYRKGESLASTLGCKFVDWPARQNADYHILVNATSIGMHPNLDESAFEPSWFRRGTYVFDVVYNPEQTLFIKYARQANCETVTGVDMFVRQAARQFEMFTGVQADEQFIREEVVRAISAARY
jgi:3-dehydroquinate dehydratase/shikimate dehydrogenase